MKVTISETTAIVTIGKESRRYDVEWIDGMPRFTSPVLAGVLIGRRGSKAWLSSLHIKKHARWNPAIPGAAPQWVLDPTRPLNSIAKNLYNVQVVNFWDLIPDTLKSTR